MANVNPRKRSSPVKIMLTPAMHDQLRQVAETLGQTPATIAAIAVGQFVAQHSRTANTTESAMRALVDQIGPEFAEQMRLMGKDSGP
jgi:predicted transcriptional regulator